MDSAWALEVMRKAPYITVSFTRPDGTAYGVPLSLASADGRIWYFHCAPEGDKLDALAVHPEVCLSAVTKCAPTVGPKDGSFTLQYRSAIAFGRAELVTGDAEKIEALRIISQRFLPQHMDAFDDAVRRSLHRTAVVRITLTDPPVGKRKQYDKQGEEMKYGRPVPGVIEASVCLFQPFPRRSFQPGDLFLANPESKRVLHSFERHSEAPTGRKGRS